MNFCKDCGNCAVGNYYGRDGNEYIYVCMQRPVYVKPNLVDGSDVLMEGHGECAIYKDVRYWLCENTRDNYDCPWFVEKQPEPKRWYQFWKWFTQ